METNSKENRFGYTCEKMRKVREFISNGINRKSLDELIEMYNWLFNKKETAKGCTNCARNRYRQIIINWFNNGMAIWKKNGWTEEETDSNEDICDNEISEPDETIESSAPASTAEPETTPNEVKPKRTRKRKNKDE